MVQVIAQLARTMSLDTVAEYVETDDIRERIAQHGVDYAQGYAVGRAEDFDEVLKRLPQLGGAAPLVSTRGWRVIRAAGNRQRLRAEVRWRRPRCRSIRKVEPWAYCIS